MPQNKIRLATAEDFPRIIELARMWPENFIEQSIVAIEQDLNTFPCMTYVANNNVEAFMIFCTSYYEVEVIWAATNRDVKKRERYLFLLAKEIERIYYTESPHRRIIYAKIAAPDATIDHIPEFSGQHSRPISMFVKRLGYKLKYRLDSFWFNGDHFLLAVKQKHNE